MKCIVTFTVDEDGGYIAECPGLPGCITHGATIDEATANIREAIELSMETRTELNMPGYEFAREIEVSV